MTVIPGAYLSKLRTAHPHSVKTYLTIIKPDVVYCATVGGTPTFGDRTITAVDVSGSISNIEAGMTVYVGVSCGDYSKSVRRYRSRDGQVLTLDENTVDWEVGDYITVVDSRDFWSIYPYITPEEPFTFYKDRDIEYSDQNRYPSPVAIMGSHKIGFLDGSSIVFTLDGSDSYAIAAGATIATYAWTCTGGSIANASAATTTLTLTTTGKFWLKLTVTDSNGKTQSSWRIVRVHNRDDDMPFVDFVLKSPLTQEWDMGGWRTSVECYEDFDINDYPDNAISILWSEQYFEGVVAYYEDNIKLAGYLRKPTVIDVYDTGTASFDIETINSLMQNTHMMSVSLTYSMSPTKWYEYYKLTTARVLHHYWKWHSTLFDIADVFLPMTETTEIPASDDLTAGSMFDVAKTFSYNRSIFANILCDKHGRVWVSRDIHMLNTASRNAIDDLFTMTSVDHLPEVEIIINNEPRIGHIIVSGGKRNVNDNTLKAIISQAPGEIPLNRGVDKNMLDNLVIASQSAGNDLAGRVLAVTDRYIEEVRIKLAGNWHDVLEILPQYWITLYSIDNVRGIELAGRYTITSITTSLDTRTGVSSSEIVLMPEVDSIAGIAGPYPPPVEPGGGDGGGGGGGGNPPPWNPPPPPPPIDDEDAADIYVATASDIRNTNSFDEETPDWESKYTGITGTIIDACRAGWDVVYNEGNNVLVLTATSVWKTVDFQETVPAWEEVYNIESDDAFEGAISPALCRILSPYTLDNLIYVLATTVSESDSGDSVIYLLKSTDGGENWVAYEVFTQEDSTSDYTVDVRTAIHVKPAASSNLFVTLWVQHERQDGDDDNDPWGVAYVNVPHSGYISNPPFPWEPYTWTSKWWWGYTNNPQYPSAISAAERIGEILEGGYADTLDAVVAVNSLLSAPNQAIVESWYDDYFGAGNWTALIDPSHTGPIDPNKRQFVKDPAKIWLGYHTRITTDPSTNITNLYVPELTWEIVSYAFFKKPHAYTPTAFDCGKHDVNKIYIGTPDKIIRSIDGGESWNDYIVDVGANDIQCHTLQEPANDDITFWGTDGRLYRSDGADKGTSKYLELNPVAQPYRIAHDPNADAIYALPCSAEEEFLLVKITPGLTTSIELSIEGARGLYVTQGATIANRRVYWLSVDDIRYTEDDNTVVSKIGDWVGYAAPVRIQPLR